MVGGPIPVRIRRLSHLDEMTRLDLGGNNGSRTWCCLGRGQELCALLHSAYTACMSVTRILRKLLTRLRSRGVSRVTSGLSSVGPPPPLMMTQLFGSWTYVSPPGPENARKSAPEHIGVEVPGALDVV